MSRILVAESLAAEGLDILRSAHDVDVKTGNVKDPTGAGDSYRGGLISGLISGKDIEQSARLGSVCASFAVECYGTQEYSFTAEEFDQRLKG